MSEIFGKEWKKEMMKFPKKNLIDLLADSLNRNHAPGSDELFLEFGKETLKVLQDRAASGLEKSDIKLVDLACNVGLIKKVYYDSNTHVEINAAKWNRQKGDDFCYWGKENGLL